MVWLDRRVTHTYMYSALSMHEKEQPGTLGGSNHELLAGEIRLLQSDCRMKEPGTCDIGGFKPLRAPPIRLQNEIM